MSAYDYMTIKQLSASPLRGSIYYGLYMALIDVAGGLIQSFNFTHTAN
jgi:hypothetical protein